MTWRERHAMPDAGYRWFLHEAQDPQDVLKSSDVADRVEQALGRRPVVSCPVPCSSYCPRAVLPRLASSPGNKPQNLRHTNLLDYAGGYPRRR